MKDPYVYITSRKEVRSEICLYIGYRRQYRVGCLIGITKFAERNYFHCPFGLYAGMLRAGILSSNYIKFILIIFYT